MLITYAAIGLVSLGVSALTLFSGFGLGTLLMPVFALFFPMPVAVASTAAVHGANSLFKAGLLHAHARRRLLVIFGLPAIAAAFIGARLLTLLSDRTALFVWEAGARRFEVTPVKLALGVLIVGFAAFELVPRLRSLRAPARWLPLGGALSGFFGGLSGHQGALRAAFLSPLGLSPHEFAATQAILACMVDAARLVVYGASFTFASSNATGAGIDWPLVGFATICAFAGALVGKWMLPKVTVGAVRTLTGALLLIVGTALAVGVV
jgi:hypothetical protein